MKCESDIRYAVMEDNNNSRKALRSCVRCRKNKIKCDLQEKRPGSCTPCCRRGIDCYVDYVVPHQRSQELINLFQNVEDVKMSMGKLTRKYEKIAREHVLFSCMDGEGLSSCVGSKVLKLAEGEFIIIALSGEGLRVNNFLINRNDIELALQDFQDVVGTLLQLYERPDCGRSCVNETIIDESVGKYTVENLFHSEQLPFLLCVVNFYFEIPGLNYKKLFDTILEDYCFMAVEDEKCGHNFDRRTLSKLIIGHSSNDFNFLFNGEMFIKKFTLYLFYHIVIYGVRYYMDCFMEKYIRTLENVRKKVNIEKNWEVKWVNFYVKVFGLMDNMKEVLELGEENDPFLKVLEYDSLIVNSDISIDTRFPDVLKQCHKDLEPLLRRGHMRIPFVKEFMAQFITMNYFVANMKFKECLNEMESMKYTGFNTKVIFELGTENKSVCCDVNKGENENKLYGDSESAEDAVVEDAEKCTANGNMQARVRKVRYEEEDVYDIVATCLTKDGYNYILRRSCCGLVRDMCEKVILEGMIMKL